jgi:hypothetical protein
MNRITKYNISMPTTKAISIPDTIVATNPIVLAEFCLPLLAFNAIIPKINPAIGTMNEHISPINASSYFSPLDSFVV